MAEHTHTTTTYLPPETIWDFVRDMDRWAPFMLGYQTHEQHDERNSHWRVKADLGHLTRTVEFRVEITEWLEPERVRFTLEGVGEDMRGEGLFEIERLAEGAVVDEPSEPKASRPGVLSRLWAALVRRFLGVGGSPRSRASNRPPVARLTFRLAMTPGGAMAPMLEAMIKPVMIATAEHLAGQIVEQLEAGDAPG